MFRNNSRSVVAIHQPNFFPWMGYFDKIIRSDVFVFLDNINYPKSGHSMGSWSNRVKILVQGQPKWIHCPVQREHGIQLIKNVKIIYESNWQVKILKTIELNYARSPYFRETKQLFEEMLFRQEKLLANYNIANILHICEWLEINNCTFIRQKDLATTAKSTDLLIEIIKKVNGSAYLSGDGAGAYQEDEKYALSNLTLIKQNFIHPQYKQTSTEFYPGLSILDVLMNCGKVATKKMLLRAASI